MSVPGPGYSLTIRIEVKNVPGMLGKITSAIGSAGGDIGAIDIVEIDRKHVIRDFTVNTSDERHSATIVKRLKALPEVRVVNVSDRVFLAHLGGKISVVSKYPVKTRDELSIAYTPGVARVCRAISEDKEKVFQLTMKKNMIAIITDGSAVLGLGDVGPEAALPVMEGKAMLFKEFAGVDAFPICLSVRDPDKIVEIVKSISVGFGGINLEDISSPRCFQIEERLSRCLDIPVFHDDQHGTAIVVLAALLNALKIVKKNLEQIKVVVCGVGAAGIATTRLLLRAGVKDIIGVDKRGILYNGRKEGMNPIKKWYAENTNPCDVRGALGDALENADVFIGMSAPGILDIDDLRKMAEDAIVFALANPEPEIMPEDAEPYVRIIATGRSDYPNQINNVLCFPGLFRGLLDCRARTIDDEMKLTAARAIAGIIRDEELSEDYIIPSVFDKRVPKTIAHEIIKVAKERDMARRTYKRLIH